MNDNSQSVAKPEEANFGKSNSFEHMMAMQEQIFNPPTAGGDIGPKVTDFSSFGGGNTTAVNDLSGHSDINVPTAKPEKKTEEKPDEIIDSRSEEEMHSLFSDPSAGTAQDVSAEEKLKLEQERQASQQAMKVEELKADAEYKAAETGESATPVNFDQAATKTDEAPKVEEEPKAETISQPVDLPKVEEKPAEEHHEEEKKEEAPATDEPKEEAKDETPAEEESSEEKPEESKDDAPAEEESKEENHEEASEESSETPAEEAPAEEPKEEHEETKEEAPVEEKPEEAEEEPKDDAPAEEESKEENHEEASEESSETPAEEAPAEEPKEEHEETKEEAPVEEKPEETPAADETKGENAAMAPDDLSGKIRERLTNLRTERNITIVDIDKLEDALLEGGDTEQIKDQLKAKHEELRHKEHAIAGLIELLHTL